MPATITNGYVALETIKAAARISDSVDDALLALAVESASREIDLACQRHFYQVASSARVFAADSAEIVRIDDAVSVTAVAIDEDGNGSFAAVIPAEYQAEPLNGRHRGIAWPVTRLRAIDGFDWPRIGRQALVRVTATWGWSAVPTDIQQATIVQSLRIFKRPDSPLGVAGYGDIGAIRLSAGLDPDVQQLLEPYMKAEGLA